MEIKWKDIFDLALEHKKELSVANVQAILVAAMIVPVPLLIPYVVDRLITTRSEGHEINVLNTMWGTLTVGPVTEIVLVLLLGLTLRTASVFLNICQYKTFVKTSKNIVCKIRQLTFNRIENASTLELEKFGGNAIVSRLIWDLDALGEFVGSTLSRFLVSFVTVILISIVIFLINWKIWILIFSVYPIMMILSYRTSRKFTELKKKESEAIEKFSKKTFEAIDKIKELKVSGWSHIYFTKLNYEALSLRNHASNCSINSWVAMIKSSYVFQVGIEIFQYTALIATLFYDLTLGEMLAIFTYMYFMLNPMLDLVQIHHGYKAAKSSLLRINEIYSLAQERRVPELQNPFSFGQPVELRMDKVTFGYERDKPVLVEASLVIPPFSLIGIKGLSGSGKSTFAKVLSGFYQQQEGQIFWGGVSTDDINLDVIRNNITAVFQYPRLFDATIRENISLDEEVTDEALLDVLSICQLKSYVLSLKNGINTHIGSNGIELSGGQVQRLTLARALLSKASILVLDEATSAIDVDTEKAILESTLPILRNKTCIIISHRDSVLEIVDHLYVFKNGKILAERSLGEVI